MDFNDFSPKNWWGGKKDSKIEQIESESEMNSINVNFTPEELNFTSLCVKAIGTLIKERPGALSASGITGLLFEHLYKEIDMPALSEKFKNAMLNDMLKNLNRKY